MVSGCAFTWTHRICSFIHIYMWIHTMIMPIALVFLLSTEMRLQNTCKYILKTNEIWQKCMYQNVFRTLCQCTWDVINKSYTKYQSSIGLVFVSVRKVNEKVWTQSHCNFELSSRDYMFFCTCQTIIQYPPLAICSCL